MRQSLEAYFLINLAVDAALIAVIARANGCLKMRRVLLGGLIAAGYAALVKGVSLRLGHPVLQTLLLILLSMVVCGDAEPRRWGSIALELFCAAMMLGGIGALAMDSKRLLAMLLGAGLILLNALLSVRESRLASWEVTVCLTLRGKSVSFRALIDTGNRLREPISGLPVLIAESSLLGDLTNSAIMETVCRRVAFGALGGGGTVKCFHPDLVLIRRGEQLVRAPEVWVAIYPGKIPGASRALAPPSFAVIPGKS